MSIDYQTGAGAYNIDRGPTTCTHEGWTDERVDQLRKLWDEGMSCSQIAKKLGGVTRNAVIGKANRLKLPSRTRPPSMPGPRMAKPKPVRLRTGVPRVVATSRAKPLPKAPPEPPPPPATLLYAKPWTERKFGECAYPIAGEGADTLSCCARTPEDATYCRAHRKLMVNPIQPKKRDTNRLARWAA